MPPPNKLGPVKYFNCQDPINIYVDFVFISDYIQSLVQLKELHMSHNELSQLPSKISFLGKLLVLDIR
jgi:Leucine-rich repeat (LRR) protein